MPTKTTERRRASRLRLVLIGGGIAILFLAAGVALADPVADSLLMRVETAWQGNDIATTRYHVRTTPTVYVIDADGKIVTAITGYNGPTSALKEAIEKALTSGSY